MKNLVSRNFCFTKYNQSESIPKHDTIKYITYQIEICPKTKKEHIQGYVEFNKVTTLKQVKKIFNDNTLHVEKRMGTRQEARDYCQKEKTRKPQTMFVEIGDFSRGGQGARTDIHDITDGILQGKITKEQLMIEHPQHFVKYYKAFEQYFELYQSKKIIDYENKIYKDLKMRPWQQEVLEKLYSQNDRQILWVHDPEGNNGKSYLAKYLESQQKAIYLENAKKSDLAYAYNYEPIVVFDYTLSNEEYINYSVTEAMKNGRLFSPKYLSKTKKFIPPKIIIMANFKPDMSKLIKDRWVIYNVPQKEIKPLNVATKIKTEFKKYLTYDLD